MDTKNSNLTVFPFSVVMPVRITDINYGMHLGHTATAGIFHNARVLFLESHGFDEMNIDGNGLILRNSNYSFKNEATFNTSLLIKVAIGESSKSKFSFVYQATNQTTGKTIADGKEEFVFFDYTRRKMTRVPDRFLDFCNINNSKAVDNSHN